MRIVEEGGVSLLVPDSLDPQKLPAFFNPKGKLVRDVSIVCYGAFASSGAKNVSFADSLAGIGARGLRVARSVESVSQVFMNDVNPSAIALAKKSCEMNHLESKCTFSTSEVCSFLVSREGIRDRFDIVDVDPFGTPSPFVDCAIRSVSDDGLLSLAATDSAVLCGVYPAVAERKYLGRSLRTDYAHEVGIRLIFGLLAMTAMRLETGIVPLFSHHDMHYFRAYAKIKVGNTHSRENERCIGFITHCFNCGFRATLPKEEILDPSSSTRKKGANSKYPSNHARGVCPACSKQALKLGGPLWIGNIQSKTFVESCSKISGMQIFGEGELDIPLYYDLTFISQSLAVRTPRINDVISRLREAGHLAGRTRLNPQGVRTDASIAQVRSAVKELAL